MSQVVKVNNNMYVGVGMGKMGRVDSMWNDLIFTAHKTKDGLNGQVRDVFRECMVTHAMNEFRDIKSGKKEHKQDMRAENKASGDVISKVFTKLQDLRMDFVNVCQEADAPPALKTAATDIANYIVSNTKKEKGGN
jgi:hypothetical protein